MYELEFPAPQLSSSDGRGPVLVHALEGFSDAGHAIRLAAGHLKDTLDTELVASFAIDELLDYRSRRPLMTFKTDHFTHYDDPELSLYALHDSVGTPFLLLAGMEPDLKWERFITAVRLLAERLGVRQTIGLGTIPMAVPHTRPVTMTAHSNNRELITDFTPWISEVQVPGSASNLLEYRMAQHGHEVVGFTVHVPHYLAQTDYPAAAQALLEQLAKTGSLQLPLKALTEAAAEIKIKVDEQVEASSEVAQVVAALERQYDAFIAAQENRSLLTRDEDLPSGDELGAEFERFLAQAGREEVRRRRSDLIVLTRRPTTKLANMTERKPNLRPVREVTPSLQFRTIHGYRRAFRIAGSGPVILLIHGIGDNSTTWDDRSSQARAAVHGHRRRPAGPRAVGQAARGLLDRRVRQRDARPAFRPRYRAGHRRRPFARRRGGDAVRLPVPATGRAAGLGRRRRRHQGRQHRVAAGVVADGQRGAGVAAVAVGAADFAALRARGRHGVGFDRSGPRPARRAAGAGRPTGADGLRGVHPDAAGGGGLARSDASPCWIDVI